LIIYSIVFTSIISYNPLSIMAKAIKAVVKIQAPAGKATPAPPLGPALGATGINIGAFCKEFNDQTAQMGDIIIPALITIYDDRTYSFILKTPPTSELIKKLLKLEKGSGVPNKNKIGKITQDQLKEIAEQKMPDLNAMSVEAAMRIVAGTAKNMGLEVVE
jgi:large subunit ribosomal protein L11